MEKCLEQLPEACCAANKCNRVEDVSQAQNAPKLGAMSPLVPLILPLAIATPQLEYFAVFFSLTQLAVAAALPDDCAFFLQIET